MTEYLTGLELQQSLSTDPPLSTGSVELDELIGGLYRRFFYLFYGEKPLIEVLFRYITVNALKTNERGDPVVAYMLLGNYRKERTNLGIEELAELAEDCGFHIWEAMRRVRIFTASSADQQALLTGELEGFLRNNENVSLVIVRGIFKLHHDDARKKNRHVVWEEVQRSIMSLCQLCMERDIPIVASGRETRIRGELLPQPESSSFLRHVTNVIVYLRRRGGESGFNRAFMLDHPLRAPGSVEYMFKVNEDLGRETKSFRQSFQDMVDRLRKEVKEPLIDQGRKTAFDYLLEAWGSEQGAMSYAESFKMLDLILLVSVLENRSLLAEVMEKFSVLEERIKRVKEGVGV